MEIFKFKDGEIVTFYTTVYTPGGTWLQGIEKKSYLLIQYFSDFR